MTEDKDNEATTIEQKNDGEQMALPPVNNETDNKVADENKTNSNKWVYLLVIITLLLAICIGIYTNNQVLKLKKEIKQGQTETSSIEKEINASIDSKLQSVLSKLSNTQQKLEELESKQDVLSHSLSKPVEQQIHVNEDYALAEIEHLLIIANYNLQLDHNVATALSAMEAVDARLKAFTEPEAISAREQLISDMNELRSLNQADLSGMALYLSDLISRVDDLELKENVVIEQVFQDEPSENSEVPVEGVKHFFSLVWQELKSLVVITRDNEVSVARLLPDEVYFLRANLKLELANARFAVFNRDTDNLHMSIKHMQSWLQNYFDMSDANVRNIFDTLTAMKKTKLEFPKLDISSSLESVRALSRIQGEQSNNDIENLEQDIESTEMTAE